MSDISPKESKKGHDESMDLAEASRESEWKHPSFVAELFHGRFRPDLIYPYPLQDPKDKKEGDAFLNKLEKFLLEKVDSDQIDLDGKVPPDVIEGLKEIGAFGMKIPKKYGGLGFSQTNYNRALEMVGGHCGNTAAWLSAHQSIGAPQPLKLVGTKAQKEKFLPRLTKEVSAFALTEPGVGSDPAKMKTTAVPSEDGKHWILNGQKLWCTNGSAADIIIVMARTPDIEVRGKKRKQISTFLVEKNMPGFRVAHRCQFMGLRGIENALLEFKNVKVPNENLVGELGSGLKIALTTLNIGRLSIPSTTIGLIKKCLEVIRHWTRVRVQWGSAIGDHEEIARKTALVATNTLAMDAMTYYVTHVVDRNSADIRIEAAMAKLFCTERSYTTTYETLQIRGGRGYETVQSLKARGEIPVPIERCLRDIRVNTILEGSSEIMHLLIAREALNSHMQVAKDLLNPKTSLGVKLKTLAKMTVFYAKWYPKQWFYWAYYPKYSYMGPKLASQFRFIDCASHRLARTIFHMMLIHQARLEKRQIILARIVEIGTELFAMAATCSKTKSLLEENPKDKSPLELADLFCKESRRKIKQYFKGIWHNEDRRHAKLSRDLMEDKLTWLEEGTLKNNIDYEQKTTEASQTSTKPSATTETLTTIDDVEVPEKLSATTTQKSQDNTTKFD